MATHTSSYPVIGRIEKFYINKLNSDTGSIFIYSSGATNELLLQDLTLGTGYVYPRVNITDNTNTAINAGSGNRWTEFIMSNNLLFIASGLGAGSSVFVEAFYV